MGPYGRLRPVPAALVGFLFAGNLVALAFWLDFIRLSLRSDPRLSWMDWILPAAVMTFVLPAMRSVLLLIGRRESRWFSALGIILNGTLAITVGTVYSVERSTLASYLPFFLVNCALPILNLGLLAWRPPTAELIRDREGQARQAL